MKSKTLIDKQLKKKTNKELVETILLAKKQESWLEVAGLLSSPKKTEINLEAIDKETKEGDTIVVPGKVLGNGNISKKIRIAAFKFSKEAEKKLKERKCEIISIEKEIKENPKAKGVKILR